MNREERKRSVLKSVSWRTTATSATIAIVFALTGRFEVALTVGTIEVISKMLLYYGHERLWNIVNWGKGVVEHEGP